MFSWTTFFLEKKWIFIRITGHSIFRFITKFPDYIQIKSELKFISNVNKKREIEFLIYRMFYCALPMFGGSWLPSAVEQSLSPHTMSSVADP